MIRRKVLSVKDATRMSEAADVPSRTANTVGVVSCISLVIIVSLEFWIPFRHLWHVQMGGLLINSAASAYAARFGSWWWGVLLAMNLLVMVAWIIALAG